MANPFKSGDHVVCIVGKDAGNYGVVYSVREEIVLVTLDNATGAVQWHYTHFVPVRECNQCGKVYRTRNGHGGSLARGRDQELFPYNDITGIGVRADNPHWFHGAFCSDDCYAFAYYEPPSNY